MRGRMLSFQTMEFVEAAERVETELELVHAFEDLLKELGISKYFLGEVSGILPEAVLRCGNWNEQWVTRYIERDYHYADVASFEVEAEVPVQRVRVALQLATVYFHARLLAFRDTYLPCDEQLTSRQRECLHWVGAGKSDWEIGEILGISETTVHTHVENAKRLYKVPTRIQAVVEACRKRELRL